MFERILEPLKAAPGKLPLPDAVTDRIPDRVDLWRVETRALQRTEDLLDLGGRLPVVGRVTTPVGRLVADRLTSVTSPPIADYDTLNARNASLAVRGLDPVDLAKVELRETSTKNRKTVLKAIAKEREEVRA